MDSVPDIVDLVLWFLATLSVITWGIILIKTYAFLKIRKANKHVIELLQIDSSVQGLKKIISNAKGPFAKLTAVGINETEDLQAVKLAALDAKDKREMIFHALRQKIHQEKTNLDNGLAVLASIGSVSPFIGLFGTVWGIMHALKGITASGSAGLDVVAGPIGEALIATAMGIAAAIPAVLAYNYFLRKVILMVTEMEHYADRFMHLVIKSGVGVE